jgi:hypothetical protein
LNLPAVEISAVVLKKEFVIHLFRGGLLNILSASGLD